MMNCVMPSSEKAGKCRSCQGACTDGGTEENAGVDLPAGGWRMVTGSAGIFLLPLFAAALGAAWAGPGALRQAIGAFAGAAVGVCLARAGYRHFCRRQERTEKSG